MLVLVYAAHVTKLDTNEKNFRQKSMLLESKMK